MRVCGERCFALRPDNAFAYLTPGVSGSRVRQIEVISNTTANRRYAVFPVHARGSNANVCALGFYLSLLALPKANNRRERRMRAAFKWVPCAAVRWGRQARRGIDRDVDSFSSGQDALSKSPAAPHGLVGHGCPASAKRGGLLFGYFLLATQEKVTRPPKEDESSSLLAKKGTDPRALAPHLNPLPNGERRKSAAQSTQANQYSSPLQQQNRNQLEGDFKYVSNNSSIRRYSSCQSSAWTNPCRSSGYSEIQKLFLCSSMKR
jgi:hypothetical protein